MTNRVSTRRNLRRRLSPARPGNPHGNLATQSVGTPAARRGRVPAETSAALAAEYLRNFHDAIVMLRDDCVCFANDAALRMFHAGEASALNGLHWHRLVHSDDWPRAHLHCGTPDGGEAARLARLEFECRSLDDGSFVAESTAGRVYLGGESVLMLVLRDITTRRHEDQAQRELRARLEERMLARAEDLRQALADARLADQAKDAFLANVSHELRTPLGGLLGLLDLARSRCADPNMAPYLEKMARAGKHLSRIINDLLDLSKIAAGRMEIERTPFSLRETLQRCQDVIAHRAEAKGIQLRIRADNAIPDRLLGDPLRLEQILLNLLGNAIKFTPQGRIALDVGLVARGEDQLRLCFDVSDTGIGMSAEEVAGLFRPFAQAAATRRKFGGTGLGLALSQKLAEAMGGRITVRSAPGEGSCFSLGLQMAIGTSAEPPGPAIPTVPEAEPRPGDHRHARVLLVEDDALNAEIVTELLHGIGIYPRVVENGHDAVVVLAEDGPGAFDLVLMDIQMPVLDGHAATRLIRSWPGFDSLPIIAMTAHALEHERQLSLAAGMNDQLSKPFEVPEFYAIVNKWLASGGAARVPSASSVAAPDATTALGRIPGLDVRSALARFGGNEERYREWLERFAAESPEEAQRIRRALAGGDRERAAASVHSFKGSVGTLGLTRLQIRAAELESAIRAGFDAVPELRQLERAIDEARREIQAALRS